MNSRSSVISETLLIWWLLIDHSNAIMFHFPPSIIKVNFLNLLYYYLEKTIPSVNIYSSILDSRIYSSFKIYSTQVKNIPRS